MSRKKRRKIQEAEVKFEFNLNYVRSEIVNSIPVNHACWIFHDDKWTFSVLDGWSNSSDTEKVNIILKSKRINEITPNNPLYQALKKVFVPQLKEIYSTLVTGNLGAEVKLTRDILVWEIIHKFLDLESPLEKRAKERKNLDEIDNLYEMIRFTELCGVLIPFEVIQIIFSYIPRTLPMIVNVGSICQDLYLSFLASWPHVNITKQNCYSIPLLVLQSVRSISFPDGKLLSSDAFYIWSKINPQRLQELKIVRSTFTKVISSLQRYRKTNEIRINDLPIKNVRHLDLDVTKVNPYHIAEIKTSLEMFPKLQELSHFIGYGEWNILPIDTKLQEVHFVGLPTFSYKEGYYCAVPKNFTYDITRVKILDLMVNEARNVDTFFERSLRHFKFLKQLHLVLNNDTLDGRAWQYNFLRGTVEKFDFSIFSKFLCLKKLTIEHGNHVDVRYETRRIGPVNVIYDLKGSNLKLEELEIICPNYFDPKNRIDIIDFNLEDMVSSGFLSSDDHKIKVFKADILLGNRMRSYSPKGNPPADLFSKFSSCISGFMDFVESKMCEKYEKFEMVIRIPNFWRRKINEREKFIIQYEKKRMSVRASYFRGLEGSMRIQNVSDGVLLSQDVLETYLEDSRMPGAAMMSYFLEFVMKKLLGKGIEVFVASAEESSLCTIL